MSELTSTTTPTPILRDYQEEAVSDFLAWTRAGERLIGFVSPTGSGKTVTLMEFLRRADAGGLLVGAVIAVPMESIERAFEKQGEGLVYCPRGSAGLGLSSYRARLRADKATPFAFLTTRQQITLWGVRELPADLAGRVLVLDEAHHAATGKGTKKLDTEIGKLRDTWHARGGTVLLMTATPFRTDGQDVLPAGTRTHVRTLAMHAASGFAPNHFQVQTAMLSKVEAHTAAELMGDALPAGEDAHGDSFRELVSLWERDGRPKAVMIVPSVRSRRWADRLIAALSKITPRERILDAVGTGPDVAALLGEALDGERSVERFEASRYDVIVACKRFDEGTDWPLCSHVYNYGIPSSLGLILQRFGRATRDKRQIIGHTHPDTAAITFLVPRVADDLLDAMEAKHHRRALTLAILQEDWRLARTMGADLSTRLHDSWRMSSASAQDLPAAPPERVRDDLRLDAKATLIAWQAKQEQATGRPATLAERHAYVAGLGLEGEKRRAMVAAALDLDVADQPEVMDFVQAEAPGLGYDFEALLSAVGAAFPGSVSDSAGNVLKIMSAFTGQDVARVVERIGTARPDLTEEMTIEAAKRYRARTGRWPSKNAGDATDDFGFAFTWGAVDAALRNSLPGGPSLATLLRPYTGKPAIRQTDRPWAEEMIIEAAKRYHARTGRWPTSKMGDATEDFGFATTWTAVDSALRRSAGELPGGSSLATLLRPFTGKAERAMFGLTEEMIVEAAKRYHGRMGRWPAKGSGEAAEYFDFPTTWKAIDRALRDGYNGLPAGSSLAQLLQPFTGKMAIYQTEATIIEAAQRHHAQTGRWPSSVSGDATEAFGYKTTWKNLDEALRSGSNGLPGGSSLARLLQPLTVTVLTEGMIIEAARRYRARTDRWPSTKAGHITDGLGFDSTWNAVDQALRIGRHGLPGGSSLAKLLAPLKAEHEGGSMSRPEPFDDHDIPSGSAPTGQSAGGQSP